jgi:hypothetical protein
MAKEKAVRVSNPRQDTPAQHGKPEAGTADGRGGGREVPAVTPAPNPPAPSGGPPARGNG